jgi:hypothetical protein
MMRTPQRDCPGLESEASHSNSSADVKLAPSVARMTGRPAQQTFTQVLRRSRRAAVRLDILLHCCAYPDPAVLYAIPPSRELDR